MTPWRSRKKFKRLALRRIAASLVLLASMITLARAEDFPSHVVTIVSPYQAGGTSDIIARLIAQKLSERWGQSVIVENKPGANGGIGVSDVAKAEPDGHRLLAVASSALTINPLFYSDLPYGVSPDLAPITVTGRVANGKTNLDQFATGLSGTRSPYGSPRCVFNDKYISGGSSSGSAVAVAAGLVSFALGTDTGGSGRVPAGINNVVGLKPTRGIVPTTGLVPNCRTLDCVSVFALTCEDAFTVLTPMRGPADDPFDRPEDAQENAKRAGRHLRYGIIRTDHREFFGDRYAEHNYTRGIERLHAIGGTVIEINFAPFVEAGRMMFDGPWVAERLHAVGTYVDSHPDSVLPVTREIILGATRYSAVDAFAAEYRLRALKQRVREVFAEIDVLVVPTTATIPTVAELEADPLGRNTRMGTYSYFVNLLDLAACAVPNGLRADGLPAGLTFIAPALTDGFLARVGSAFHQSVGGPLGKTRHLLPALPHQSLAVTASGEVRI